jgi:hypothetical protein
MSKLSSDQSNALRHWSEFGQRGEPATKRVTAKDWKTHPFKKPVTSKWDQSIPRTELPKLLNGFQPTAMEDKWFVYADGPDAQGNAILHMYRSWTGFKVVELKLVVELNKDGEIGENDPYFTEITWESEAKRINGQREENAKTTAKGVCNWCMNVRFP